MEVDIDPAHSPELENIRAQTDQIPDNTFRALFDLMRIAAAHQSRMIKLESDFEKNESIPHSTFNDERESLRTTGNAIMRAYHRDLHQHVDCVETSWDELILRMLDVFARSENTEHWRGRLNAIKDEIVPQISAINPLLAPAESIAKVAVGLSSYEVCRNLDKKLIDLGISDGALREDAQVLVKTKSGLKEYQSAGDSVVQSWRLGCLAIYSPAQETSTSHQIQLANEQISQFISPIKEYLLKNNDRYGNGITVIREVNSFCDVAPKIIKDIERIFAAKEIFEDCQKAKFVETVSDLGDCTFKYLELMNHHFNQREISPTKQKEFLLVITRDFISDTKFLIRKLYEMLDAESSSRKSKKAEKKRMAEDRFLSTLPWKDRTRRTLVRPGDVRKIVEKVDKALNIIYDVATASGIGQIMEPIDQKEGSVQRAHVKVDTSNDTMTRLHQVLGEDVVAGSQRFQRLLEKEKSEEKPMSFTRRIKKFFRLSRHKC
ncbi:hypothetical protein AGABI1DRAFT_128751 [Agaricus bisporus var. burnettii JB137-S8]|uniref:Uncharacterized protein n=1 Tax=Agaricus bisporus var. burnettii (strain JB137-S8 / ATCC MYA-4627 / FGSC 10392) TaxID=597362 RepID=K5X9D9_AGABU|nr:uncharacterized protein AGABI1DRAFT_128751 [Agaricus bisporus var. burnettii JB137-S8]EKM79607.1 hypothetical protein AGABI1DRAFT_128751 [Agaricus bisporus var. burnettii JB137-S8]